MPIKSGIEKGARAVSSHGHMTFVLLLTMQFQLWDTVITQVLVKDGLAREANPLMAPLINTGSFMLVKLIGMLALLMTLWVIHRHFPRAALAAASSTAVLYLGVITWNFLVLFSNTV